MTADLEGQPDEWRVFYVFAAALGHSLLELRILSPTATIVR